MFRNSSNKITEWGFPLFAILLFSLFLSACASPAPQTSLSEQVPPRRGAADTLVKVQEITTEMLGVPELDVVEGADFRKDLGADEEEMNSLGEAFAEAFEIELSEAEIKGLTTVQSAVDLIESK